MFIKTKQKNRLQAQEIEILKKDCNKYIQSRYKSIIFGSFRISLFFAAIACIFIGIFYRIHNKWQKTQGVIDNVIEIHDEFITDISYTVNGNNYKASTYLTQQSQIGSPIDIWYRKSKPADHRFDDPAQTEDVMKALFITFLVISGIPFLFVLYNILRLLLSKSIK
jgi:hypothetical protein